MERFWTYLSALMEGIFNISKKTAFWKFLNKCSVQVLHDVHDLYYPPNLSKYVTKYEYSFSYPTLAAGVGILFCVLVIIWGGSGATKSGSLNIIGGFVVVAGFVVVTDGVQNLCS